MSPTRTHTPLTTQDLHVLSTSSAPTPRQLELELPIDERMAQSVVEARDAVKHILLGKDSRLLVIVGPCSIHDEQAALEYAKRLDELRRRYASTMLIVMRVYFEKPRTTTGWKGLIYDPRLDGSLDIAEGLPRARKLLRQIVAMGMPAATEFLDPVVPQYLADLVSWAAVGARTTESQTHRQMASGLSMPVGYKNSTQGDLGVAVNAMLAARTPQSFLGVDHDARVCIVKTTGNRWGHVILRGGADRPNYEPVAVASAASHLEAAGLTPMLMVDCSHANAEKQHQRQQIVWRSIIEQRAQGNTPIIGAMLESNLHEGNQKLTADLSQLQYGVSVTDACIGWDETADLLQTAHEALAG